MIDYALCNGWFSTADIADVIHKLDLVSAEKDELRGKLDAANVKVYITPHVKHIHYLRT